MLAAERLVPPIAILWQREQLCDANFRTADSTLRAHRVVLAAFSDKLLEQFLKEDQESPEKSSTLNLPDCSSVALNNIIRFCYTGQFDRLTAENIEETLTCCRRLDFKVLLDRCVDYLSTYDASNALSHYVICKRCELATLSERIWLFCCENFESISRTTSFLDCNRDVIIQLLSEDRLNVTSEMCVLEAALAWLEFQAPERFASAQNVMSCVRLSLVNPEDIVHVAEPRVRILHTGNPYGSLFRAMAFHSLKKCQSALTPKFASQPRICFSGGDSADVLQSENKKGQTPTTDESMDAMLSEKATFEKEGFLQRLKTKLLSGSSRPPSKDVIYLTGGMDMRIGSSQQGLCISKCSTSHNNWEVCSKIKCDTHHHAAVYLDGEIFITGGFMYDNGDPCDYGKPTDLVSVYNPKKDAWTSAAKLLDSRAHHGAVVYEKNIYIVCGMNHFKQVLESVEQYDSDKDQWMEVCKLPSGRLGAAIALCQHCVYIAGGYNRYLEFPILDEILCLDLKSFSWVTMKPFGMPICHAALACVQDQLYLVGGRTLLIETSDEELLWSTRSSDLILKFDPKSEEWEPIEHMQSARHDATVAVSGSNLIIMGGMCSPTKISLNSVECFNVEKNVWNNTFPPLPFAVSGASAVCLENL